jgi:hypothetical protein
MNICHGYYKDLQRIQTGSAQYLSFIFDRSEIYSLEIKFLATQYPSASSNPSKPVRSDTALKIYR